MLGIKGKGDNPCSKEAPGLVGISSCPREQTLLEKEGMEGCEASQCSRSVTQAKSGGLLQRREVNSRAARFQTMS